MNSSDYIREIKSILSTIKEVEFGYLFGSFASNAVSAHSDIDIAIYVKDGFDNFDVGLHVHHKLEIALNKSIDLIILNDTKNYRLLRDIIYQGILVKDSENRPVFEVQKQHEIIDFFNFKQMIDAAT